MHLICSMMCENFELFRIRSNFENFYFRFWITTYTINNNQIIIIIKFDKVIIKI